MPRAPIVVAPNSDNVTINASAFLFSTFVHAGTVAGFFVVRRTNRPRPNNNTETMTRFIWFDPVAGNVAGDTVIF